MALKLKYRIPFSILATQTSERGEVDLISRVRVTFGNFTKFQFCITTYTKSVI